jgi:hypothetical protein
LATLLVIAGAGPAAAGMSSGVATATATATQTDQPARAERLRQLERLRLDRIRLRGDDWRERAEAIREQAESILERIDLDACSIIELATIESALDVIDPRSPVRDRVAELAEAMVARPTAAGAIAAAVRLSAVAGWEKSIAGQREAIVRLLDHPGLPEAMTSSPEVAAAIAGLPLIPRPAAAVLIERPELVPAQVAPNEISLLPRLAGMVEPWLAMEGEAGRDQADRYLEALSATAYATMASLDDPETLRAHMLKLNPHLMHPDMPADRLHQLTMMSDEVVESFRDQLREFIASVERAPFRGDWPDDTTVQVLAAAPARLAPVFGGEVWWRLDDGRTAPLADLVRRPTVAITVLGDRLDSQFQLGKSRLQGVADVVAAVRQAGRPMDGVVLAAHRRADDPAVARTLARQLRERLDAELEGGEGLAVAVVDQDDLAAFGVRGYPTVFLLESGGVVRDRNVELSRRPFLGRRVLEMLAADAGIPVDDPGLDRLRRGLAGAGEIDGRPAPAARFRLVGGTLAGSGEGDASAGAGTDATTSDRTLEPLRGRVIVLSWWNHASADARAAVPALNELAERYAGQDVVVLTLGWEQGFVRRADGVIVDTFEDPVAEGDRFAEQVAAWGFTSPVGYAAMPVNLPPWRVRQTLDTVVIDRDGVVRTSRLDVTRAADRVEIDRAVLAALRAGT